MFVNRHGNSILVRYESWMRTDSLIEGHMEVVDIYDGLKLAL
jgi:hypothetical protein